MRLFVGVSVVSANHEPVPFEVYQPGVYLHGVYLHGAKADLAGGEVLVSWRNTSSSRRASSKPIPM
jgi:hypothetical protein